MNADIFLIVLGAYLACGLVFAIPFALVDRDEAGVDEGGYLLYFVRSEGSFAAGANTSVGKARTSAIFKKPTKDFEDTINKGRFTMTALPDFTPLQGGVPIIHDGQVIGAIGVSGAKSAAQDEEVAKAGAAVLLTKVAAK